MSAVIAARRLGWDGVGIGPTRIMLALLAVYHRDGRATCLSVAAEAGRSLGPTHYHLRRLDDMGLVGYGTPGGLRPLCTTHQPGATR